MGDLPKKNVGLIVMSDLPKKYVGLIVMSDLPKKKRKEWSHCNGWSTQIKKHGELVAL